MHGLRALLVAAMDLGVAHDQLMVDRILVVDHEANGGSGCHPDAIGLEAAVMDRHRDRHVAWTENVAVCTRPCCRHGRRR